MLSERLRAFLANACLVANRADDNPGVSWVNLGPTSVPPGVLEALNAISPEDLRSPPPPWQHKSGCPRGT
jgi:hypothetical protein